MAETNQGAEQGALTEKQVEQVKEIVRAELDQAAKTPADRIREGYGNKSAA
jgi:hypothetical protein